MELYDPDSIVLSIREEHGQPQVATYNTVEAALMCMSLSELCNKRD